MAVQGLFSAMKTSSNTLSIMSEGFASSSTNIANANTEDYIKTKITTVPLASQELIMGAKIASFMPDMDIFNLKNLQEQKSVLGNSNAINQYLQQLNLYLGNPTEKQNIAAILDNLFSAFSDLSMQPNSEASMQNAANVAVKFASSVSDLATKIQKLRYEVDHKISDTVNQINNKITNIKMLNDKLFAMPSNIAASANIQGERILLQNSLSALIDVNFSNDSNGKMNIQTEMGALLMGEETYRLLYVPASSLSVFTNNESLNPLQNTIVKDDGTFGSANDLISGGTTGNISSFISKGELSGLQQLRDVILPQFLERLDNFAAQTIFNMNKIQNSGAGSSLQNSFIGTQKTSYNDARNWSGTARIGVVDNKGNPIYTNEEAKQVLKPLDINFSKLDGGNGPGVSITTKTIINEINQYFISEQAQAKVTMGGFLQNGVQMGGISDVKIISKQSNISANSSFSFEFEVDNQDKSDFSMQIISLNVNNDAVVTSSNNENFTSKAGSKGKSGLSNTVSLGGNSQYTIVARVMAKNEATGEISISDISYVINTNQTDTQNLRIPASAASGDNTVPGAKGAQFINSIRNNRGFISAELVDDEGNVINSNSTKNGYLKISSTKNDYYIVIDDRPVDINNVRIEPSSEEQGINNYPSTATKKGFSHFFGLNNLFEENNQDQISGSAQKMAVTEKITKSGGGAYISRSSPRATMPDLNIYRNIGNSKSSGSIEILDLPAIGDTITIANQVYTFTNGQNGSNNINIASGDLNQILQNFVNTLNNSSNIIGVNLANYSIDTHNPKKINISSNVAGSIGNSFTLSYNFATARATINDSNAPSNTGSDTLKGGTDILTTEKIKQLGFGIASEDKFILEDFIALKNNIVEFPSTKNSSSAILPINAYLNQNIFGYIQGEITNAKGNAENNQLIFNQFNSKFLSEVGVDVDSALSDISNFQNTYIASAKIIAAANKLLDVLFSIIN